MTAAMMAEPRAPYEPPPNTEHDGDWRWYVHPLPPHERFVSVTTALDVMGSQALIFWASGLAAQAAFAELPKLVSATLRKMCGQTYNDCAKAGRHDRRDRCAHCPCGECRDCVQLWLARRHFAEKARRADEGRRVHKAIEWWSLNGGQWPATDPDIYPYLGSFRRFVADYGLSPDSWELAEATVLNREHGYAGTLDGHLRVRSGVTELADDFCARLGHAGGDVLVAYDAKSKEKQEDTRVWPDHAMQLSAYRRGECIMLGDGTEYPLPATDGAAVLQLRPDNYQFKPVRSDEQVFGAFLRTLGLFNDLLDGNTWVSIRSFPLPEDYKREKANRKARERRAAKKTATVAAAGPAEAAPAAAPPATAAAPAEKPATGSTSCRQCFQLLPAAARPGDSCPVCGTTIPKPRKAPAKKPAAKKTEPALSTAQRIGAAPRTPLAAQVQDPFALVDQPQDPPF